jgi:hypothetical protein
MDGGNMDALTEPTVKGFTRIVDGEPEILAPATEPFELTNEEYFKLSRKLETYHAIFYKFWEMGRPLFTEKIPTAAIQFNHDGGYVEFLFNPKFWQSLTEVQRIFIICHESLHVLLNHGERASGAFKSGNPSFIMAANVAMDLVINHMLVDQFYFDRVALDMERFIWRENVFKDHPQGVNSIDTDMSFEGYFTEMKYMASKMPPPPGKGKGEKGDGDGDAMDPASYGGFDDHSSLPQASDEALKEKVKQMLDQISPEEAESIFDAVENDLPDQEKQAGTLPGGHIVDMGKKPPPPKKKWETIIKKWSVRNMADSDSVEVWHDNNRRTSGMLGSDMLLPNESDQEAPEKNILETYFFLDTSPSCRGLEKRFWDAALSLPKNRFRVSLFSFAVDVHKIDPKSGKLHLGNGTYFHIIEEQIQKDLRAGVIKSYPKAVFVITDGYGSKFDCQKPENWYWLLSHDHRDCIPAKSKIHMLSEFE